MQFLDHDVRECVNREGIWGQRYGIVLFCAKFGFGDDGLNRV